MNRRYCTPLLAVVGLALLLAGCTSVEGAYERDPARALERGEGFRFDDPGVERSFSQRSQLRFPSRVAVAGVETGRYGSYADRGQEGLAKAMEKEDALWSEVLPIPSFLVAGPGGDAEALRRAAARMQADLLLLYEQRVEMVQDHTPLVVLNILLLPALFVPSCPYEATIHSSAALVDVRNGLVYATATDLRTGEGIAPSAFLEGSARDLKLRLMEEGRGALLEDMRRLLLRFPPATK